MPEGREYLFSVNAWRCNLGIYEVVNAGWWYDLGFYLAVISGFGGLSLTRKKIKEPGGLFLAAAVV